MICFAASASTGVSSLPASRSRFASSGSEVHTSFELAIAITLREMDDPNFYRGWRRPGPVPPGGVDVEDGETLDFICGHFRVFQYAKGHRYSTDDVLTAWYGTTHAPRVD